MENSELQCKYDEAVAWSRRTRTNVIGNIPENYIDHWEQESALAFSHIRNLCSFYESTIQDLPEKHKNDFSPLKKVLRSVVNFFEDVESALITINVENSRLVKFQIEDPAYSAAVIRYIWKLQSILTVVFKSASEFNKSSNALTQKQIEKLQEEFPLLQRFRDYIKIQIYARWEKIRTENQEWFMIVIQPWLQVMAVTVSSLGEEKNFIERGHMFYQTLCDLENQSDPFYLGKTFPSWLNPYNNSRTFLILKPDMLSRQLQREEEVLQNFYIELINRIAANKAINAQPTKSQTEVVDTVKYIAETIQPAFSRFSSFLPEFNIVQPDIKGFFTKVSATVSAIQDYRNELQKLIEKLNDSNAIDSVRVFIWVLDTACTYLENKALLLQHDQQGN